MNRMNFDVALETSYPLSIDRLAEWQGDTQLYGEMMSGLLPLGNCIVSGCGSAGAGGVVLTGVDDGAGGTKYELMAVKANANGGNYLVVVEEEKRTLNSDGVSVVTRVERRMEWAVNAPDDGTSVYWPGLLVARMKKVPRDRTEWTGCYGGGDWYAPSSGGYLLPQVRTEGGRIHLYGKVKYAPKLEEIRLTESKAYDSALGAGRIDPLGTGSRYVLPLGWRPKGQVMIPVRYNGAVSWAEVDGESGVITLAVSDWAVGDEMSVDTYMDY